MREGKTLLVKLYPKISTRTADKVFSGRISSSGKRKRTQDEARALSH